jgi:hypothetical protein
MKLLAVLAFLCVVPVAGLASEPATAARVTSVVLEQYACPFWGTCPHFILAINSDGTGSYIGLEATKTKGTVPLKLPPSAFNEVIRELDKIGYFNLHKSYSSTDDGCKEMATDQNSGTFFAVRDGQVKAVDIYWGCKLPGVTDNLAKLAALMDKVAGIRALIEQGQ